MLAISAQAITQTDDVKEKMIALMMELEDAYNAHNTERVLALFSDDAVFDVPPTPLFDKEGERELLEWYWEFWPNFSLADPLFLASVMDKVGLTEHTDLYSYPDNGAPIETPHICVKDFEGDKMTRLTIYGDFWADELIQAGLMPPRKLGNMVPSFPLPEPQGTGLSPMEASVEFMKRLNSGDLINTAKMIRKDANIWFPFINRKATRPEFIDIYEQILVGFPDAHWEMVRRADMGDGWIYFEAKLIGTNKGEFLTKPATGHSMEVRGGWVERYDENGLATYLHAHFDSLAMPGQEAPAGSTEDFSNVFFMELSPGLNMISAPLKPSTPFTARSLAEHIGATVVIKYDEAMGKFVGFDPKAQGDGFPIEGGKGYIVNVPKGGTVTFTGAAWTNEPTAGAAPGIAQRNDAWAFMFSGFLVNGNVAGFLDEDFAVMVKNLNTGERFTGTVDSGGYFSMAWADLNRKAVVSAGHKLEITMTDANGNLVSGPFIHEVTSDNIRNALANKWLKPGQIIPKQSALLQNYPNPFNPETWIPFQLSKSAYVSIRIYDSSGKMIRNLALGHKEAGVYADKGMAIHWDGKNDAGEMVASGIYYYSITADEFSATRKMIIAK